MSHHLGYSCVFAEGACIKIHHRCFVLGFFFFTCYSVFFAMARPQPDSRVDDQSPAQPQTCRMEVLRRDAWPSGGTLILQSRQRHRTVATQTSTVPVISTQDSVSMASSPQQEGLIRDSSGTFIIYTLPESDLYMWLQYALQCA